MAEFFECGAEWGRFFGVVEKSTKLGFSSRGEDHFHDGGEIEDGAIEDVRIYFVSEVEVASLSAVGDRIPSTTPGAEPPRDAKDSGSARPHSTHLETSSTNRP